MKTLLDLLEGRLPNWDEDTIKVLKLMIKHYEERGGGHSQKLALEEAIQVLSQIKQILKDIPLSELLDEGKMEILMTSKCTDEEGLILQLDRGTRNMLAKALLTSDVWKEPKER